jgi:hypothetical protein
MGRWRAGYRGPDGRERSRTFDCIAVRGDDLDEVSDCLDAALVQAAAACVRPEPSAEIFELPSKLPEKRSEAKRIGAPSRIRTYDTRFRKPLLYPLSYGG